jgi:hypothetical protein
MQLFAYFFWGNYQEDSIFFLRKKKKVKKERTRLFNAFTYARY